MDEPFLPKRELPPPPGDLSALDYRYVTSRNDWYLKTADGWFWLDQREMLWKPVPYGSL